MSGEAGDLSVQGKWHADCVQEIAEGTRREATMRAIRWALGATSAALLSCSAQAQTVRAVMHADIKIIDPIWTSAYNVRNYGYMVYDTLLAMDEKLAVQPQMLEGWKISDDKLTYTFTPVSYTHLTLPTWLQVPT